MGKKTNVEWAMHTFNPWVGCQKVGRGCDNCYAETWAARAGSPELWQGERRRTTAQAWRQPRRWNREAAANDNASPGYGRPVVLCASLADVFDNRVPTEWRADLWALIRATPALEWVIVTKRIGSAAAMLPPDWGEGYANVTLIATVTSQMEADRDIPRLLALPAARHGVSIEPMLGPIDMAYVGYDEDDFSDCGGHPEAEKGAVACGMWWDVLQGYFWSDVRLANGNRCGRELSARGRRLAWVICGGESGANARPVHPWWVENLRNQCEIAGVPFFFKQWGEWAPLDALRMDGECAATDGPITGRGGNVKDWMNRYVTFNGDAGALKLRGHSFTEHSTNLVYRIGKTRAGRMLDGVIWDQLPPGFRVAA